MSEVREFMGEIGMEVFYVDIKTGMKCNTGFYEIISINGDNYTIKNDSRKLTVKREDLF